MMFTLSPATAGAASTLEDQFLEQLNAERRARNLPLFVPDNGLTSGSRSWSQTMSARAQMVHAPADGMTAEIIGRSTGTTGQITDAWMRSASHRNLIVDPNLRWAGIGVVCDGSGQMWATVRFTRADTRLGTLQSSNQSPIATAPSQGGTCGNPRSVSDRPIRRLYRAYFSRDSDRAGLDYWMGELSRGASLESVAEFFAGSPEFHNTYGHLNNAGFVDRVYQNVMGRGGDASGRQYWTGQLNAGMRRGDLMVQFSESVEFRNRTGLH